jgi:hypothetical protein
MFSIRLEINKVKKIFVKNKYPKKILDLVLKIYKVEEIDF